MAKLLSIWWLLVDLLIVNSDLGYFVWHGDYLITAYNHDFHGKTLIKSIVRDDSDAMQFI